VKRVELPELHYITPSKMYRPFSSSEFCHIRGRADYSEAIPQCRFAVHVEDVGNRDKPTSLNIPSRSPSTAIARHRRPLRLLRLWAGWQRQLGNSAARLGKAVATAPLSE
jgi:hypothetical protein